MESNIDSMVGVSMDNGSNLVRNEVDVVGFASDSRDYVGELNAAMAVDAKPVAMAGFFAKGYIPSEGDIISRVFTDAEFCRKAVLETYGRQTGDERAEGGTKVRNAYGFSKKDVTPASTLARILLRGRDDLMTAEEDAIVRSALHVRIGAFKRDNTGVKAALEGLLGNLDTCTGVVNSAVTTYAYLYRKQVREFCLQAAAVPNTL